MRKINLSIDIRLRPVRLLFIIEKGNTVDLEKIFTLNTNIWGGQHNPILVFDPDNFVKESIDFYEPDVIVFATEPLKGELGLSFDRTRLLSEMLIFDEYNISYKLPAIRIYEHVFNKTLKFVLKNPPQFVKVIPSNRSQKLFCSAVFGTFFEENEKNIFSEYFNKVFEPKETSLNSEILIDFYKGNFMSALDVGSHGIKRKTRGFDWEPIFFFLDMENPEDILDFWNARIIYLNIMPVPIQFINYIIEHIKNAVISNYRLLPRNKNGVMIGTRFLFANSILKEDRDVIMEQIEAKKHVLICGINYPSCTNPQVNNHMDKPLILVASEKNINAEINENSTIEFDALVPDFKLSTPSHTMYVNVVNLKVYSQGTNLALIYPKNYNEPKYPSLEEYSRHPTIVNDEGIITFDNISHNFRWKLPLGREAISIWLKNNGIDNSPSKAGSYATQVIDNLGGILGVHLISNEKIINLFNRIAGSITKSSNSKGFWQQVCGSNKERLMNSKVFFEQIVDTGIVKIGLDIECTKCNHVGWFALNVLDEKLTCDMCLSSFRFPVANVGKAEWSYRLTGPFSLDGYAKGGYSVALTIRAFHKVDFESTITYCTGLNLIFDGAIKREIDFGLWYKKTDRNNLTDYTQIIFGECKSFGEEAFEPKDVELMKILAEKFPGAIFVFSTMRVKLDPYEKALIAEFAEWGREYALGTDRSRAPVIVLTGNELFSESGLPMEWRKLGGKWKELIEKRNYNNNYLRQLADFTQQLYLEMQPYFDWWQAKHTIKEI